MFQRVLLRVENMKNANLYEIQSKTFVRFFCILFHTRFLRRTLNVSEQRQNINWIGNFESF